MSSYAGADWLKPAICPRGVSPFGEKVANILGDVFFGIYHLNRRTLSKVDWMNDHDIEIVIYDGLSTYDSDKLTRLVVLCHDRMVRLEICAARNNYLRLCFGHRKFRYGDTYTSHPTLEDAAERIRSHYAVTADPDISDRAVGADLREAVRPSP